MSALYLNIEELTVTIKKHILSVWGCKGQPKITLLNIKNNGTCTKLIESNLTIKISLKPIY